MKKILYISICLLLFFSCDENKSNQDSVNVNDIIEKQLVGFSLTTKNTDNNCIDALKVCNFDS